MNNISYKSLEEIIEEFGEDISEEELAKIILDSQLIKNSIELHKVFTDNVVFGECAYEALSDGSIRRIDPMSEEYATLCEKFNRCKE